MEDLESNSQEDLEQNLREQIIQYLSYWPWFAVAVFITISISLLFLRYATPIYETQATILIKDEKNSALSELAAFQDLGFTGTLNQSGFENEMLILKSKSLTERVVKELHLNIKYISEGNIRDSEYFENSPIKVNILTPSDSLTFPSSSFYILPISELSFEMWEEDGEKKEVYSFGEIISLPLGDIMVLSNFVSSIDIGQTYIDPIKVVINNIPATVAIYRQNIQVEQLSDFSSVLQLTLKSSNTRKSEAVLNELIKQYNQDAIDDRNMVSKNTANFINTRLEIISEELDSVETGKVEFKESNKLTDIVAEGQIFLQNESEFTKRVLAVETQLELVKAMISYVKNAEETDLLPANLGINNN